MYHIRFVILLNNRLQNYSIFSNYRQRTSRNRKSNQMKTNRGRSRQSKRRREQDTAAGSANYLFTAGYNVTYENRDTFLLPLFLRLGPASPPGSSLQPALFCRRTVTGNACEASAQGLSATSMRGAGTGRAAPSQSSIS